ncbi:signal peptidase complex subunit 3-like [Sycon ciliatum]|uniref:signal peptidase complex subunit 3-like n=1 Tax=Sycon ciliatum TaxID=27933 RepID=UPI0031F70BD6
MNTLVARGNAVFAFGFSAVSALSLACFLSTCMISYNADVTITPGKIVIKQVAGGPGGVDGPADLAFMKFGLDADILLIHRSYARLKCVDIYQQQILMELMLKLMDWVFLFNIQMYMTAFSLTSDLSAHFTDIFNWNTKMLFVYLMAEYKTSNNALSQVVIWDKKIMRGDNAHVQLENMNTKYHFIDDGTGLRGNDNVTLVLQWNVIPNTGSLPFISGGAQRMHLPSSYVK